MNLLRSCFYNMRFPSDFKLVGLAIHRAGMALIISISLPVFSPWTMADQKVCIGNAGHQLVAENEYRFFLEKTKYEQFHDRYGLAQAKEIAAFWEGEVEGRPALEVLREAATNVLHAYRIELAKAAEKGFALNKSEREDVDIYFYRLTVEYGSRENLDNELVKTMGIRVADYEEIYSRMKLAAKFRLEWQNEIAASQEELKHFYLENRNATDAVVASHIARLKHDPEDPSLLYKGEQLAATEAFARELYARADSGESFAHLVYEYSQDVSSKANDGKYRFHANEGIAPEFEAAAFLAKVGEISWAETNFAFHIIKVESRTEFKDVQERVLRAYRSEKYNTAMEAWKEMPEYRMVLDDEEVASIRPITGSF